MFCANHPDRIAIVKCNHCEKPICDDCQVMVKGIVFCEDCSQINIAGLKFVPSRDVVVSTLLSIFIPGSGQAYNGQVIKGFLIFFTSWLILPWIYGIFDAAIVARKINRGEIATTPSFERLMLFLGIAAVFLFVSFRAFQHFLQKDYTQDFTQKNLLVIARAMEEYAYDHEEYPKNISALYISDPPYLEELYCDIEISRYEYKCNLGKDGYHIVATPIDKKGIRPKMSVETGGVLKIYDYYWYGKEKTIQK